MGIIPRYSQTELGGMAVSLPKPWRLAAAAAALLILGDAAHAADVQVGIASAIVPSTVGSPRSAASRTLVLGADILFKERINTDRAGQAQIIFLDHSSLAIAPNSSLVIDEFVYDPDKSAGKLAVSASKGLLRYIGGKISKGSDVTFTTPIAMIAIRGGMVLVKIEPSGRTTGIFLYGQHMIVTAAGVKRTVTRPGYQVTVEAAGQPPGFPARVPQDAMNAAFASFGSTPGQPDDLTRGSNSGALKSASTRAAQPAEGGGDGAGVNLGRESAQANAGGTGAQPDPESVIEQGAAGSGTSGNAQAGISAGTTLPSLGLSVIDAAISDQHIAAILNSAPLAATASALVGKVASTTAAVGATVSNATTTVANAASATVSSAASTVSNAATTLTNAASETVSSVTSAAASTVSNVGSIAGSSASSAAAVASSAAAAGSTVAAVVSDAGSTVASVASAAASVGSAVSNVASTASNVTAAASGTSAGTSSSAATKSGATQAAASTLGLSSSAKTASGAGGLTTGTQTVTTTLGSLTKAATTGITGKLP